ncbi:MAG: hypothetical protein H0U02_13685 [Rubrobacter sp.]|jgi:hypothetical protein|nr:hypothetical protein [Rubrobacter sp.]
MRRKATALGVMLALVVLAGAVIGVAYTDEEPVTKRTAAQKELQVVEAGASGASGPLSPIQKRAIEEGPLVPNQDEYERDKAEANARAEQLRQGEASP